jgi:hypothetical protein
MRTQPPEFLDDQARIIAFLAAMRSWFQRNDIQLKIKKQAKSTAAWLIDNKSHFDEVGCRKISPWWVQLPPTDNLTILHGRRLGLIDKVSEHGWRHMLQGLSEERVILDPSEAVFELLNVRARSLLNELTMDEIVDQEKKSLRDLARRFGIETNKFRNRPFVRLAGVGAILGEHGASGYKIAVGPVAYHFFSTVFAPVVMKFDSNGGLDEQGK